MKVSGIKRNLCIVKKKQTTQQPLLLHLDLPADDSRLANAIDFFNLEHWNI